MCNEKEMGKKRSGSLTKAATLTLIEVQTFTKLFFEMDVSMYVKTTLTPIAGTCSFIVTIKATEEYVADLLRATFSDGLLGHREWDKKFSDVI